MNVVDVIAALKDLQYQATREKSHYYVGKIAGSAIEEIEAWKARAEKAALERDRNQERLDNCIQTRDALKVENETLRAELDDTHAQRKAAIDEVHTLAHEIRLAQDAAGFESDGDIGLVECVKELHAKLEKERGNNDKIRAELAENKQVKNEDMRRWVGIGYSLGFGASDEGDNGQYGENDNDKTEKSREWIEDRDKLIREALKGKA